jgi:hypothetical protein
MSTKKLVIIIVSVLAGLFLLIALFVGAIVGSVLYGIGHSEAATTAQTFLRGNEKLKQEIGEVKDFGYFVTGSINAHGDDGNASLGLKVIGERQTVWARVDLMYRQGRQWRVTDASYKNGAGQTIDLLGKYDSETP